MKYTGHRLDRWSINLSMEMQQWAELLETIDDIIEWIYNVGGQGERRPLPFRERDESLPAAIDRFKSFQNNLVSSSLVPIDQETVFRLPRKKKVGHSTLERDGERKTNRFAWQEFSNELVRAKQKQLSHLTASRSPLKAGCRDNPQGSLPGVTQPNVAQKHVATSPSPSGDWVGDSLK